MTTIRATHDKENPYTCISNVLLRDPRISFKARGVLALLLSYPDDWEINVKHLAAQSTYEGPSAVKSALKELTDAGYILQKKVKDAAGRFIGTQRILVETAVSEDRGASSETATVQALQTPKNAESAKTHLPVFRLPVFPQVGNPAAGFSASRFFDHILNNQFHELTKLQKFSLLPLSKIEPGESGKREKIFGFNWNPENQENPEPAKNFPQAPESTASSLSEVKDPGLDQNSGGGAVAARGAADKTTDARRVEVVEHQKPIAHREDPRLGFNSRREALQQRVQGEQYPKGVWMRNGLLNEDFVEWLAQDWLRFPNSNGCIHTARANVRAYFWNKPEMLPIRWEQYHSKLAAKVANVIVRQQSGGTIGDEKQNLIQHQAALTPLPPEHAVAAIPAPVQDYAQHLVLGSNSTPPKIDDKSPVSVAEEQTHAVAPALPVEAKFDNKERIPREDDGSFCENVGAYSEFRAYPKPVDEQPLYGTQLPPDYKVTRDDPDWAPLTAEDSANCEKLRRLVAAEWGKKKTPTAAPKVPEEQLKPGSERSLLMESLQNMYQRIANGCQRWMAQDAEQLLLAWQREEWNLRGNVRSLLTVGAAHFKQLGLQLVDGELEEEF